MKTIALAATLLFTSGFVAPVHASVADDVKAPVVIAQVSGSGGASW